jgi:hypothetical protein
LPNCRKKDIEQHIKAAKPLLHTQIISAAELVYDVERYVVDKAQMSGWSFTDLPELTAIMKGLRKGEMSIWTGPTGSGKTTLLSMLSVDMCRHHNVRTLWGSFEINNVQLLKKMVTQYAGKDMEGDSAAFREVATKFAGLPMYFMKFHGSTRVEEVLDAMEHAAYSLDVQHILLDNLQFMTSNLTALDKWMEMERALSKFREFATKWQVHLSIVIHPRKTLEDQDLSTDSIFGIAKSTQEADNVVILQSTQSNGKRIEVKKNRWDGTLGQVALSFSPDSLRYSQRVDSGSRKKGANQKKPVQSIEASIMASEVLETVAVASELDSTLEKHSRSTGKYQPRVLTPTPKSLSDQLNTDQVITPDSRFTSTPTPTPTSTSTPTPTPTTTSTPASSSSSSSTKSTSSSSSNSWSQGKSRTTSPPATSAANNSKTTSYNANNNSKTNTSNSNTATKTYSNNYQNSWRKPATPATSASNVGSTTELTVHPSIPPTNPPSTEVTATIATVTKESTVATADLPKSKIFTGRFSVSASSPPWSE